MRPPRNGRWSGFRHLLMARLLELKREPEVIFWVFGFPVLLALGLGIAFRNKPADITRSPSSPARARTMLSSLLQRSPQSSSIHAAVLAEAEALQGFRLGKYDLVVVPDGKGGFQYRYDPPARRACCRAPKSTMLCKRRLDARIRCRLQPSPPASPDRATSTS